MPSKILWISSNGIRPEDTGREALFAITDATGLTEALGHLEHAEYDAIVVSLPLDSDPEFVFDRIGAHLPLIVHAPAVEIHEAVLWTKLGAYQVVRDLADVDRALHAAIGSRQIRTLAAHLGTNGPVPEWRKLLIGESRKMHEIAEIIRLVAPRRCTILITGETGTGKEVVARAIHAASNRSDFPMVSVNCSALPEALLEAELFGHVKGAFTGAMMQRAGRFEQAHGGTLFLDEIGDLPLPLQAKLLRVLQEREFQRLGSSETIRVDVRVIAATNADLERKVRDGEFREDLYYRLNVVPVTLPPLRERPDDLAVLTNHFVNKICRQEHLPRKHISDTVLRRLVSYDWPGNVRQLENAVEMALALSGDRTILYPTDFAMSKTSRPITPPAGPFFSVPEHGLDFEKTVSGIERNILEQALRRTGGNKKAAAEMLRLKRTTLTAKLKSLAELEHTASDRVERP